MEYLINCFRIFVTHPSLIADEILFYYSTSIKEHIFKHLNEKLPQYLKAFFRNSWYLYFPANTIFKMSLHWTIIAGFLYGEIAALLLLLIPFISPRTWNKLFKSRLLKGLESQLIYYFYVLVTILVLFFLGKSLLKALISFQVYISCPRLDVKLKYLYTLSIRCYSRNAQVQWRPTRF